MKINLIACMDSEAGIGRKNKLPWRNDWDMKFFKKMTTGFGNNGVIMGKNTYASLGYRPLPNRINFIISTTLSQVDIIHDNTFVFPTIQQAVHHAMYLKLDALWVIGGSLIYEHFLSECMDLVDCVYVTHLEGTYNCDTFFPTRFLNFLNKTTLCEHVGQDFRLTVVLYNK